MLNLRNHSRLLTAMLLGSFLTGTLSGCLNSDSNSLTATPLTIATPNGSVSGSWEDETKQTVRHFRGIPYAQAPVGDLRFAPPVAKSAWDSSTTSEYASPCPQSPSTFSPSGSVTEDCLFLNVSAPSAGSDYPVMVWIHGGAFIRGDGGANYNPSRLVGEGLVVVTLNYRLGALGFLANAGLSSGEGNFGLMDQQMALQWVQDNIENFGGDAGNVTIFGESAGGHSVLSHLASPSSAGLFHKAIPMSGAYAVEQKSLLVAQLDPDLDPSEEGVSGQVANTAIANAQALDTDQDENTSTPESCAEATLNTQDCLRALSVAEILLAQGSVWSFPTTGTSTLPKSFAEQLTSGDFNKVPVMIGGNLDEGKLFVALNEFAGNDPITDMNTYANTAANPVYLATGGSLVPGVFAGYVQAAAAEYASHNYEGDAEDFFSLALAGIWTDGVFACHNKNMISELAEHVNTYAYEFTDILAPNVYTMAAIATGNNNLLASIPLGAAHSFELQYLFQPISRMQVMGGTEEQVALSESMVDYFAQFAKTGNPNSLDNSLESWSTFADSSAYQNLNTNMSTISSAEFSAAHNCDFWEGL